MGLIGQIFTLIFGGGRNAIRETAEVFRENAEGAGVREAGLRQAVMQQFAAEFSRAERGWFDRLMDAINRIPRPALALGTLALFLSAMFDPIWFSARMQGIALVPQPLWWLLGVIVSFYFGRGISRRTRTSSARWRRPWRARRRSWPISRRWECWVPDRPAWRRPSRMPRPRWRPRAPKATPRWSAGGNRLSDPRERRAQCPVPRTAPGPAKGRTEALSTRRPAPGLCLCERFGLDRVQMRQGRSVPREGL